MSTLIPHDTTHTSLRFLPLILLLGPRVTRSGTDSDVYEILGWSLHSERRRSGYTTERFASLRALLPFWFPLILLHCWKVKKKCIVKHILQKASSERGQRMTFR
jgi:hypothetical protein